jgi:chemotaxis protein CheZ
MDINKTEQIEAARALITALESGDDKQVKQQLGILTQSQESELFHEVGKLTRQLHQSMSNFNVDSHLADLTENHAPNTRERLNYVIKTTEEAAHKTLGYIEQTLPLASELQQTAEKINQSWHRFRMKEMSDDEFNSLSEEIKTYLPEVTRHSEQIHANMTEMMLAQEFQDLTGQVIRQVINLVEEVEHNLVQLVKVASKHIGEQPKKEKQVDAIKAEGPQINAANNPNVMHNQDEVDDLLSSLGF